MKWVHVNEEQLHILLSSTTTFCLLELYKKFKKTGFGGKQLGDFNQIIQRNRICLVLDSTSVWLNFTGALGQGVSSGSVIDDYHSYLEHGT